jgi:hypothetical protein
MFLVKDSGRSHSYYGPFPLKSISGFHSEVSFEHIVTYQTLEEYQASISSHLILVQVSYRVLDCNIPTILPNLINS